MNYKLKENAGATGLDRGRVYSAKEIEENFPHGGAKRLLATNSIEETSEKVTTDAEGDVPEPTDLTGSPLPLSKEDGKAEEAEAQRKGAMPAGDGTKARTASEAEVKKVQAAEAKAAEKK